MSWPRGNFESHRDIAAVAYVHKRWYGELQKAQLGKKNLEYVSV